jgi:hypothetical protein
MPTILHPKTAASGWQTRHPARCWWIDFEEISMKSKLAIAALGVAVAAAPLTAGALGKNEKGCLVGGAAGGVGGKLLGDHAVVGALGGCAVGTLVANDKDKKQQAAKRRDQQRRPKVAHNERAREEPREEPRR